MKAGLRRGLLAAGLAATLAAVFLLDRPEETLESPTKKPAASARTSAAPAVAALPKAGVAPGVGRLEAEGADLFPARSWRPAPPPAAPVPPSAPPLPYEYKGRLEEGGQSRVFLARQQTMLVVKQGDTLDGLYHVDAVTPWTVEFTYLPLKQKQSLSFSK
ncbi:MAG: hypothetical protein PHU46_09070 [Rhodocyclaceae bacterium]|nr:hypothetical protein [Rhodocyclaceae bacterium]